MSAIRIALVLYLYQTLSMELKNSLGVIQRVQTKKIADRKGEGSLALLDDTIISWSTEQVPLESVGISSIGDFLQEFYLSYLPVPVDFDVPKFWSI